MEYLRIGLSACFFYPDPKREVFSKKTLLYFEECMVQWLMSYGAFPILLPRKNHKMEVKTILSQVDGLVLQGGVDVSPASYQEQVIKEEWSGDRIRDEYEIELVQEAVVMNKPVLGICRGLQLINVAFGGSLYQDIATQVEGAILHRDPELYDSLQHEVELEPMGILASLYNDIPQRNIISIHHQAIKSLGKGLAVEAKSKPDGIIEAIRHQPAKAVSNDATAIRSSQEPYVLGLQWHPEFQDSQDLSLMSAEPILLDFLEAVRQQKLG